MNNPLKKNPKALLGRLLIKVGRRLNRTPEKPRIKKGNRIPHETLKTQALAYRHLVRAQNGLRYAGAYHEIKTAPTKSEELRVLEAARDLHLTNSLLTALANGGNIAEELVGYARKTGERGQFAKARPLLSGLSATPELRNAALLARGVLAKLNKNSPMAWKLFSELPLDFVLRAALPEYFSVAFRTDPERAEKDAAALIKKGSAARSTQDWLYLFQENFGAQRYPLAAKALANARQSLESEPSESTEVHAELRRRLEWYEMWSQRAALPKPRQATPDKVHFGIMTYDQADLRHSSSNLGDYTQTISATGHLLRHSNLKLSGDKDLVKTAEELQGRIRSDRVIEGPGAEVELHLVRRDLSSVDLVPFGTWMLWFGWHMHNVFDQRTDFPLNENIRPLFVSFHVNRAELLTSAAVDYLKQHGPIGCRDWATTYLLLAAGIDAFFSGCLTTTIDTVFPETGPIQTDKERRLWVDAKNTPKGVECFKQGQEEVRTRSFSRNMSDALAALDWYRKDYNVITTSRLHSCLPSRAIGLDVDFRAKNPADIRFEGLIGLSDDEFCTLKQSLLNRIAPAMSAILRGASETEVRKAWQDACADDVAKAKDRLKSLEPLQPRAINVAREVEKVRKTRTERPRKSTSKTGDEIHIEVSLDGNFKHQLEVVLDAVETHCSRPLHIYVLSREHGVEDHDCLALLFPEISFTWFHCDEIDYGPDIRLIRHITVATMDRLLLPDLLPDLAQIIHLDLDTLPMADITEVWNIELGDTPLAARTRPLERVRSGFQNLLSIAKSMKEDAEQTSSFLRRYCARHDCDFEGFNAGLMLLNLTKMRADNFCETFLPYVEAYGLHDQDILNFYAGANRADIEGRWNRIPRFEVLDSPAMIHWAGREKPWDENHVPGKEYWVAAVARLQKRKWPTEEQRG